MTASLADQSYNTSIFDKANSFINYGINTASAQFKKFEEAHPKLVPIAKKILPLVVLIASLVLNPLATLIGLGIGLLFADTLKPIADKIQKSIIDAFKNTNLFGKILITAGAVTLGFALPGSVQSGLVGVTSGIHIKDVCKGFTKPKTAQ